MRLVGVDALESALADPRLRQDVFSYLAEQVYARETAEVRAFLRRTCCLDHVSADLATRVGAPRRAHRILAHLQANGVFTFADRQEGRSRYHSLFREFLRQKSVQEDGGLASTACSSTRPPPSRPTGDVEKAVDLCLAANEPRLALDVVARAGEKNLDAFRSETLDSWLERLPDQIMHTEPWARLLVGQVDMRAGRFDEALRHQAAAAERFETGLRPPRSLSGALGPGAHPLLAGRHLRGRGGVQPSPRCGRLRRAAGAHADQPRSRAPKSSAAGRRRARLWPKPKSSRGAASPPSSLASPVTPSTRTQHGTVPACRRRAETARHLVATHGSPSLQTTFLNLASDRVPLPGRLGERPRRIGRGL